MCVRYTFKNNETTVSGGNWLEIQCSKATKSKTKNVLAERGDTMLF